MYQSLGLGVTQSCRHQKGDSVFHSQCSISLAADMSVSLDCCLAVRVCSASAVAMSSGSAWTTLCASISPTSMPHGLLERMLDHTQRMISLNSMQAPDLGLFVSDCMWLCLYDILSEKQLA